MVKFWERITSLPEDRLVKVAYRQMINENRKDLWPNIIREILNSCGMSGIWNQGQASRIRGKRGKDHATRAGDPLMAGLSDRGGVSRCVRGSQGGMGGGILF